ncbi:hypothetical protein B0H13DRAFT_2370566 [Mycena leptocephala]|nr:hypothetical protein B0H13DRAFT_2370566 [Mycena leptocephala]
MLDTGSRDLWLNPFGGVGPFEEPTGVTQTIHYGDGSPLINGTIRLAEMTIAGRTIPQQAFINVTQTYTICIGASRTAPMTMMPFSATLSRETSTIGFLEPGPAVARHRTPRASTCRIAIFDGPYSSPSSPGGSAAASDTGKLAADIADTDTSISTFQVAKYAPIIIGLLVSTLCILLVLPLLGVIN